MKLVCQTPLAKLAKLDVGNRLVPAVPLPVPSAPIMEIKPTSFYGKKTPPFPKGIFTGPIIMRPLLSRQDRLKAAQKSTMAPAAAAKTAPAKEQESDEDDEQQPAKKPAGKANMASPVAVKKAPAKKQVSDYDDEDDEPPATKPAAKKKRNSTCRKCGK